MLDMTPYLLALARARSAREHAGPQFNPESTVLDYAGPSSVPGGYGTMPQLDREQLQKRVRAEHRAQALRRHAAFDPQLNPPV